MAYAIVVAGGKQHRVEAGERLRLDRQAGEVGAELKIDQVLLLGTPGQAPKIGQPHVAGAAVTAKIVAHGRGAKIRVFKRRKRKGFSKMIGHRQDFTEIEITQVAG